MVILFNKKTRSHSSPLSQWLFNFENYTSNVCFHKFLLTIVTKSSNMYNHTDFAGSSNGRTPAFEAENRGSSPCPPNC